MSEGACYQNRDARDMALISMLRTAHTLISQSSVIKNLDRFVAIRDAGFPIQEVHSLFLTLDPPFLDAFRIATCFENLFKAELLAFGYVVHKFDRKAQGGQFKALALTQDTTPVCLTKLRELEGKAWKRKGAFTIIGLRPYTLTLGQMINKKNAYKNSLRLSKKAVDALEFVQHQRNTIHFVVNDMGCFNTKIVDWYLCLRSAANTRLLPRYLAIVDRYEHLKGNPQWFLSEV